MFYCLWRASDDYETLLVRTHRVILAFRRWHLPACETEKQAPLLCRHLNLKLRTRDARQHRSELVRDWLEFLRLNHHRHQSAAILCKLDGFGIEVASVGVKDIVLPGEMKTILAQVVEAEKSAQANVIRRREETAATRSLLNTAKVMEDNPVALRLKELETLERVAERIDKISVFGGLDQVLNGLVKLR